MGILKWILGGTAVILVGGIVLGGLNGRKSTVEEQETRPTVIRYMIHNPDRTDLEGIQQNVRYGQAWWRALLNAEKQNIVNLDPSLDGQINMVNTLREIEYILEPYSQYSIVDPTCVDSRIERVYG